MYVHVELITTYICMYDIYTYVRTYMLTVTQFVCIRFMIAEAALATYSMK